MSKTDKTAPWTVRALNRPSFLEEHHDHRGGRECNLPAQRELTDGRTWAPRTGCAWVVSMEFLNHPENRCGCPGCSDQVGRKAKTRKARSAGRAYAARTWVREYE